MEPASPPASIGNNGSKGHGADWEKTMTDQHDNKHVSILAVELAEKKIDRREFVRFATLLGLSAPIAYAMAGKITGEPFALPARADSLPRGGVIRIGNRIKDIKNPHTYSWGGYDSNMSRQVVEYLTFTDDKGVTKPYLFESWTVSPDLKTWTFKVRKGVKWSNGQDLVSDHIIWNLKRVLDDDVGSSMPGLMKGYMLKEADLGKKDDKGNPKKSNVLWDANAIERVDDFTVRLNCQVPQVAVPEHLFHYPMAILHPDDKGVFGVGSIGTGAFTLTEFELGKRAAFKRRAGYWGGDAALDGIEMTDVGDDATAAIAALASKQLHGLVFADNGQYQALSAMPHLQLYSVPTAETQVMRMRVTERPFDDARVRQAMRLAIDPEVILKVALLGLGKQGEHHHVSVAHPEYASLPLRSRDVAAAKKLLADAGHKDGIEVELHVPTDIPWGQVQAETAVEQWKEAGITVNIKLMPGATYWDVWTKVPFGSTIWYHRPLGIMALGLAYRTGVAWNETAYSNKDFDELLTKAEGVYEVDQRREIMAKLEKIMQDDGPLVQPIFRDTFTFMDKKVKGFSMHPTNYFFGWQVGLES
jgi:peptide/nickel transport system substrate-binding protein